MMTAVNSKIAVLAAGGTGGHLFPAQSLAEALKLRGIRVHLMTDERVRDYGKSFPAEQTHIVPAATLSIRDPLRFPARALRLASGIMKARSILRELKPAVVAGFGGYPSFPPLYAASMLGIPTLLHEQNAVLGRANARLAKRATRIALSFAETRGIPDDLAGRLTVTGNPVRTLVLVHAGEPYPELQDTDSIRILVFGGSQGAKFFSDFMPGVFEKLGKDLRSRIFLVQQCRPEDLERTRKIYADLGMMPELQAFFTNLPERIAHSHLVVSRSGASTIAELGVIGRPAIMVPLPHALDNDQLRNAQSFAAAGAGWIQPQKTLTHESLAQFLTQLLANPATLQKAATAALRHGKPGAAQSLADLAQSIMSG